MKRIFAYIGSLAIVTLLTQCQSAHWVQLNKIASVNCRENNSHFMFENDTLAIEYIFSGENGSMMFTITNKLSVPLYVDWKKCNYILNNTRNAYYDETVTAVTNGYDRSFRWAYFTWGRSSSITVVKKEERITFLPPGTTVANEMSGINSTIFPIQSNKHNSKKITPASVQFNQNTSPIAFRNYLTFSLKENSQDEFMLDHVFYLSSVENAHENKVSELAMDKETMSSYMKEIELDGKTFFVRYSK